MASKLFQKRVEKELLNNATELYSSLGTSVGDAFVMFLKKSIDVNGLPFELKREAVITLEEGNRVDSLNEVKERATPILKKHNINEAYIFGSFARGDFNDDSDIDVMVLTEDFDLLGLIVDLEKKLGRKVDVLIEDDTENSEIPTVKALYKNYVKERVKIYEK